MGLIRQVVGRANRVVATAGLETPVSVSFTVTRHAKSQVPVFSVGQFEAWRLLATACQLRSSPAGRFNKIAEAEESMKIIHRRVAAIAAFAVLACCGGAWAQGFSITITVDENCDGTFTNTAGFFSPLTCALLADPGPGGLGAAVTYDLLSPPGLTAGDLILLEPAGAAAIISDIIRFNPQQGTGSLVFYSDNLEGSDALADTGFPTALYTNTLTVTEVGPEGSNGFSYTPTSGQPGFVTGAGGPITYVILSDTPTIPEPATLTLLGISLVAFVFSRRAANH
jgi:hypothetical protein